MTDSQPALGHYVANRTSGDFAPCAALFAVAHLPLYRDDPLAGIDPVAHYLDDIAASGESAFPDPGVLRVAGLLDQNYYLINAADVHEADIDPVEHYCRYGWLEHRKPNIYFDPAWYALTNPDFARLRVNPLVHYSLIGERANRRRSSTRSGIAPNTVCQPNSRHWDIIWRTAVSSFTRQHLCSM